MKTTLELNKEQKDVMKDLVNFIKHTGIEINNQEDLNKAFLSYLQNGSASNFYFKCDEHQKSQFTKRVTNLI